MQTLGWALVVGVVAISCVFTVACGGVVQNEADAGVEIDAAAIDAAVDLCDGPSIALENFTECFASYSCRLQVDCFGVFPTFEACLESDFALGYSAPFVAQVLAQVDAGTVAYDGEALADCFNPTDTCNSSPPACNDVFLGTVAQGGACFESQECLDEASCETTSNLQCTAGTCGVTIGLNGPCDTERCKRGLVCVGAPGARTCRSGDAGETCQSDFDCDSDLRCDEGTNLCGPLVELGGDCVQSNDCERPYSCVASTCQRPDTDGDTCTNSCIGALFCESSGPNPVCRPLPTVGESCALSNRCLGADLFCSDADVCTARPTLGEACVPNADQCVSGSFCDAATSLCATPKANGAMCDSNRDCSSGVCEGAPNQSCVEFDTCY